MITRIPFPACRFLTLTQGFDGGDALCLLCDWEGDGLQLTNPASGGGANDESLTEAPGTGTATVPSGVCPGPAIILAEELRYGWRLPTLGHVDRVAHAYSAGLTGAWPRPATTP